MMAVEVSSLATWGLLSSNAQYQHRTHHAQPMTFTVPIEIDAAFPGEADLL